ncbi:MAG: molecular chaperone TorD family protein [Pseudorhodobacter sp.]|nr:molecular chaperone TorD family protein [Pseudorhodobacter sp.]
MSNVVLNVNHDPALSGFGTDIRGLDRQTLAMCYLWLAHLFAAPPDCDRVASYRRGKLADWIAVLSGPAGFGPQTAQITRVLDSALDDRALAARLGAGHARLFAGAGGPATVSPYESAYFGNGRLFQAPAAEMAALLSAHDLSVDPAMREPADYLPIELALIAHFIASADSAEHAVRERLSGWIPKFCAKCADRDDLGFWAGAAQVLAAILESDPARSLPGHLQTTCQPRRT